MRPRSIRIRLTLWYFAVQAITFAAFGIGIFLAVRESVHAAIDQDLRLRLEGIQRFMVRVAPTFSQEDLRYEIREHSGLRPGGDLLQVSDAQGDYSGSADPRGWRPACAPPFISNLDRQRCQIHTRRQPSLDCFKDKRQRCRHSSSRHRNRHIARGSAIHFRAVLPRG
jgi:hypothetical protein